MRSRFQAQPDGHRHLDVRQGEARAHHRTRAAHLDQRFLATEHPGIRRGRGRAADLVLSEDQLARLDKN
jgi:hypothetical protein